MAKEGWFNIMCILIMQPKGLQVPDEYLKESSKNNPDGAGIAWLDKDTIKTFKSLNQDLVISKYKAIVREFPESNIMLHFRIMTHGEVEVKNIHPFFIKENVVMGHNGIINNVDTLKGFTDSYSFGMKFKELDYKNTLIQELFNEYINHSKLVYLDKDNYYIIGEDKGEWNNGIWYSNTSYQPRKIVVSKKWNNYGYEDTYDYNYYGWSEEEYDKEITKLSLTDIEKEIILHALWSHNKLDGIITNKNFFYVSHPLDEVRVCISSITKSMKKALRVDLAQVYDLSEYSNLTAQIVQLQKKLRDSNDLYVSFEI